MSIFRSKAFVLLPTFAVISLAQQVQAQAGYYGFVNPYGKPGGVVLPQYTSTATAATCSTAVANVAVANGLGYACLGNDVQTADIASGCSPVQYGTFGWIYPAACYTGPNGCPAANVVTIGTLSFCNAPNYESKVTPRDNEYPPDSIPKTTPPTTPPATGEYLPTDQQGPAYNFVHASNMARLGALGVQIHIHYPQSMNRFVLRIPTYWDRRTLIVGAANGLASEHTYDRTVSDWAVSNGYAYMGNNKGSYMQTAFAGLWSAAEGRYLPIRPNETQPDDAACQFAPDTYFNPLLIPEERVDGVSRGQQNNHKFIHIPSLIGRQSTQNVLMNWRNSFIQAVKTAKALVKAQTGSDVVTTIAFGVSAGGGIVKSVAEYAEAPQTKFVDGVMEVAGIQLSTDGNNIMNVYNILIQNWPGYVGRPPPFGETLHFGTGPAYTNIIAAGFPFDRFNLNATGLTGPYDGRNYNNSWPATPTQEYWHPDRVPFALDYKYGGRYLDWTMNSSVYWLQCMFIRGFDPTYSGTIEAYPFSRISTPGTDVYKRLQAAGAPTGAINTPVMSLGGAEDTFAPPNAQMFPYQQSITSSITHVWYHYRRAGHLDALATGGPGQSPALWNNSFGLHFMTNRAREPLTALIALGRNSTPPPPSQCVYECTSLQVLPAAPCTNSDVVNVCSGDFLEFGADPNLPQSELVNW